MVRKLKMVFGSVTGFAYVDLLSMVWIESFVCCLPEVTRPKRVIVVLAGVSARVSHDPSWVFVLSRTSLDNTKGCLLI